jgi:hypothetical protein
VSSRVKEGELISIVVYSAYDQRKQQVTKSARIWNKLKVKEVIGFH